MDEQTPTNGGQTPGHISRWMFPVVGVALVAVLACVWVVGFLAEPERPKIRGDSWIHCRQFAPPPGDEPEERPVFDVRIEVDKSTPKNRVVLYISETHGYYVECPIIELWWHEAGNETGPEDLPEPYPIQYDINNVILANQTFKDCIEITNPELEPVGGDIGTDDNWSGRVIGYSHARLKNMDPPRVLPKSGRECG